MRLLFSQSIKILDKEEGGKKKENTFTVASVNPVVIGTRFTIH